MTERYGYDKTPTPPIDYDRSLVPKPISDRSKWVRTKYTGEDVAEAYAQGMDIAGLVAQAAVEVAEETKNRQDAVETYTAQSVAQMEADKNAVIANATVDSEVILARGGKDTLGQRLDETTAQLDETTAQLAQNEEQLSNVEKKLLNSTYISFEEFGLVADSPDIQTEKLQQAIDYAEENSVVLFQPKRTTYVIDKPLYTDGNLKIIANNLTISKVGNTSGEGSNTNRDGTFVSSYEKDAVLIGRHPDNEFTRNVHIENVHFRGNDYENAYGFYAPYLAESSFNNISANGVKNTFFGYCWFLISEFRNITQAGGDVALEIADDGSSIGGSTSINADSIYTSDANGIFKVFGLSYSTFNIPMGDRCKEVPMTIRYSSGITLNSPSTEGTQTGRYLFINSSDVTVNTPRAIGTIPSDSSVESKLFELVAGSRVIVNAGSMSDYLNLEGLAYYANFPVFVSQGSRILFNGTRLPQNAQAFYLSGEGDVILNNQFSSMVKITKNETVNIW